MTTRRSKACCATLAVLFAATGSGATAQGAAKPATASLATATTVTTKPATAKPAAAKPATAKSASAKPAAAKPANAKSAVASKVAKTAGKAKPGRLALTAVEPPTNRPKPVSAATTLTVDGFKLPGQVIGIQIAEATVNGMKPKFWAGVNLGATLPGTFPGELAPTREDYDRWLVMMNDMGVSLIRTYTILPPRFYDALRAYDLAHASDPLYVLVGIWVPEDRMYAAENAYDPEVLKEFRGEITDAVGAVHGDLERAPMPGHASGSYHSDIAPWVLGYSLGIEWDPYMVQETNKKNATAVIPVGTFIVNSPDSNPMEKWIGMHLDLVAALEAQRGWSRPLTFTNWITADPIHHPDEPFVDEDSIAIDSMHFSASPKWVGGFFASYHAYPYYPDFLRIQPSLLNYTRPDGTPDAYAGYLHEIHAHHVGQALMVTEFGQPTSIGLAHRGPNGRDQGGHSEIEASTNNMAMMRDMHDEGLAGGVMFEWLDEWFKFTWNSIEHELPKDRRSMWRNPLTNEEHFGILAMEAGPTQKVVLDGSDAEWVGKNGNQSEAILQPVGATGPMPPKSSKNSTTTTLPVISNDPTPDVRATSDEESLYLRVKFNPAQGAMPWTDHEVVVGLDLQPEGNNGLPDRPGVMSNADVAIIVGPGNKARLRIAAFTDPVPFEFGIKNPEIPINLADLQPESGVWREPIQVVSRELRIPSTNAVIPLESVPFGDLRWGSNDPTKPGFDDRNLVNGVGSVLELRIPWGMIGMADPSSKLVLRPQLNTKMTTLPIDRIGIGIVGPDNVLYPTAGYSWAGWNLPKWHERKKMGWPILQSAFYSYLTN